MRKKDIQVGLYVTCLEPRKIYSSNRSFMPGMVGTITTTGGPRDFLIDFYSREMPDHEEIWRCSAFAKEVRLVSEEQAMAYLGEHAPTWEEHLDKLIAFYNGDRYQVIQKGKYEPYPTYEAHTVLVPYLLTKPTQQAFLTWLETYRLTYAYTAESLTKEVSTLQLSHYPDNVRIPWTYRTINQAQ